MGLNELAEGVLPSETYCAVTYDRDTNEVGIQYGYVLVSLPAEDLSDLIALLTKASSTLK